MSKQHYILNEKYRPENVEGYLCTDDMKSKIESWIKDQNIPHLLFVGRPGSGKTTLAKILIKNIDCSYLYLNATDERSMDVMRDKVRNFASSASFKSLKIVILDEADFIRVDGQALLRNLIEEYSAKTRFILTGNYPERLIDPLRSRLEEYKLEAPSKKITAKHFHEILNKENVEHEVEDLASIINQCYPDLRRTFNTLQKNIKDNRLILTTKTSSALDYSNQILTELKNKNSKSWSNIRQIIADNDVTEFDSLYKFLYQNIDIYSKHPGLDTIVICEGLNINNTILDKEIGYMATIQKLLNN
jgi:replication factor C small subunit